MASLASPRCVAAWHSAGSPILRRVSLWLTPCAVESPPPAGAADVLLCPGNQALAGAAQPYFERGGSPVTEARPSWESSGSWCGMSAGTEMIYPTQCIDGVVDRLGGKTLRKELKTLEPRRGTRNVRCEVGAAVAVRPPENSALRKRFRLIVHTPPPIWPEVTPVGDDEKQCLRSERSAGEERWRAQLRLCYESGLHEACALKPKGGKSSLTIVAPLLGAGTAGAPSPAAAALAADAAHSWVGAAHSGAQQEILFAVRDEAVAEIFFAELEERFRR